MLSIKQTFNIHTIHMRTAVTKHALFPVQLQPVKEIAENALDVVAEEMVNCLIWRQHIIHIVFVVNLWEYHNVIAAAVVYGLGNPHPLVTLAIIKSLVAAKPHLLLNLRQLLFNIISNNHGNKYTVIEEDALPLIDPTSS